MEATRQTARDEERVVAVAQAERFFHGYLIRTRAGDLPLAPRSFIGGLTLLQSWLDLARMGASYGLGFIDIAVPDDLSREEKLQALRALATAGQVTIRDGFDGIAVEVSPGGEVKELGGDEAAAILRALDENGGSAPYSSFEYLDGYVVCVDGAEEGEVSLPHGDDSYIGPLEPLVERLDQLLARDDIADSPAAVHRALRKLCDLARRLRLPVNLGG
jgi:hypothetical protein